MKCKLMGASALVLTAFVSTQALAQSASSGENEENAIVVTGTRTTGLRAVDSPAPVQVLGNDILKRTGSPDLIQDLAVNVPSLQAQSFGGDEEEYTLSYRLRGLSPNDTLVLIDGDRRHNTANVAVGGGPYGGSDAPDISFIPPSAIDHVEILQDGAAAQYGTDAIAGVINIILKKNPSGGSVSALGGQYFDGGGLTTDFNGNIGLAPLGDKSYLNITYENKFHGMSFRGDVDPRVLNLNGSTAVAGFGSPVVAGNTSVNLLGKYPATTSFPNYPYSNRISGDGQEQQNNLVANAGYNVSDALQFYATGTIGYHDGRGYENYRLPNVVVSPSGVPLFPAGFDPEENNRDTDYAFTLGAKGDIDPATTWHAASTYGRDYERIYVLGSANASYYTTYGTTPYNFHDGDFTSTQWTNTVDLTHNFNVGLASPLAVAAGAEYRVESYQIKAGDPASYYGTGAQSFFGYSPVDAGYYQRENVGGYLDANVHPLKQLTVDAAVRFEHYTDFGNATVEKLTGRYDFNDMIAVRGTASTGFRAPTLAEEHYIGVNVGPTSVSGVFAPNSAGAQALGLSGLKPETSTNYSVGLVTHFMPRLTMTLDAYSINIENRIVESGTFYGYNSNKNVIQSPSVISALTANGVPIDPTIYALSSGSVGIQSFVNGVSTLTRGADFVATYPVNYGGWGRVDYSLSANYNTTGINSIAKPPKNVNQGVILLAPDAQSQLTDASPKYRVTFNAYWSMGKFSANVRESYYGSDYDLVQDPILAQYDKVSVNAAFITDLELGYEVIKGVKITAGANNLFNTYPTQDPFIYRDGQLLTNSSGFAGSKYPTTISPFGFNGGFYYGRVTWTF